MDAEITLAISAAGCAIITAVGLAFRDAIRALTQRWINHIQYGRYVKGISRLGKFHEAVERIAELDFVKCSRVFRGRNGGGFPDPIKPYYIELLWEKYGSNNQPDGLDFELKIDSTYCGVLKKMCEIGKLDVRLDAIPANSQLSTRLISDGVIQELKYFLIIDGAELLYITVMSGGKTLFTDEQVGKIDNYIERVRSTLRD